MVVTLENILQIQQHMRRSAIEPNTVRGRSEAMKLNRIEKSLTRVFPRYTGKKWRVGDRYYLTRFNRTFGSRYVPARAA